MTSLHTAPVSPSLRMTNWNLRENRARLYSEMRTAVCIYWRLTRLRSQFLTLVQQGTTSLCQMASSLTQFAQVWPWLRNQLAFLIGSRIKGVEVNRRLLAKLVNEYQTNWSLVRILNQMGRLNKRDGPAAFIQPNLVSPGLIALQVFIRITYTIKN